MHDVVVDACSERGTRVRIGPPVKQQLCKGIVVRFGHCVLGSKIVRIRDNAGEQGGMATETIGINHSSSAYVHPAPEQPVHDFEFAVIDAKVQERCAG